MAKKLTEKGERIRHRMVETTARILREEGFKETTVRRIAAEAHVNIASVRYYFGSKEELIGLALDYMMGNFENIVSYLDDPRYPAKERLRRYMTAYFQLAKKHPALFKSISRPSSAAASDTYFVYLTLIYDQCWTKFMRNVAEMTGYKSQRDIELKSMQLFSALEFPIILESNKADFFLNNYTDATSLTRYIDLLLSGE